MPNWMTASDALAKLRVRPQTLYAYVSRGLIEARQDAANPRSSLYRREDIDRLATRKARGRKPALVAQDAIAWGEPVLASAITTVAHGRLFYRGKDAAELAKTETLEEVACLLRGDVEAQSRRRTNEPPVSLSTGRARLFAALASRAGMAPAARGRAPAALAAEATALLDIFADAVAGQSGRGPIHRRIAAAWAVDDDGAELIRRALVLLADHELNASTFAARVAASTGASLAASALAGLSALSGPLHGGMATRVEAFIAEARRVGAEQAVAARLDQVLKMPGFGHPLYPGGDPRAAAMLEAFEPPQIFREVHAAVEAATGEIPNVDFALTSMSEALELPADAPFLLFAVARCAGWLAHAIEQLQTGELIRPRARYIGPPTD